MTTNMLSIVKEGNRHKSKSIEIKKVGTNMSKENNKQNGSTSNENMKMRKL